VGRRGGGGVTTRGYIGQVYEVRPVLAAMESRGMPIDDAERRALDAEFDRAQRELGREIAAAAPLECRRVHPKQGYKGVPPEVKAWWAEYCAVEIVDGETKEAIESLFTTRLLNADPHFQDPGDDGETYHYDRRAFPVATADAATGDSVLVPTLRWCRVYDFNPNSPRQLLDYMRARKHTPPKSRRNEDADGNAKETTEKKELVRLAHKTGDTFYLRVIEYRELSKARGTYVEGFRPGADGRVHTTFTFDTGTGQLSSRNPNVQNFPKHARLAKSLRRMVAAPPGHVIVEFDYRAFHVLTTGFEAESANWMRLARLDMHSFVAGDFLKVWDAAALFSEPDEALADRFRWFKSDPDRKRVRDKQAKPADLGIGFGMGYRRLYQENMEHFDGEKQARRFHDTLRALFPEVFAWQQRVRRLAHDQQYLRSKFGHMRRFYEVFRWDSRKGDYVPGDQAEEAVAFLPANHAHGHLREVMKSLAAAGLDSRYGMFDQIHDALLFCPDEAHAIACVEDVSRMMTAPSLVLRHPTLAPNGLWCGVDISAGRNWSEMREVSLAPTPPLVVSSAQMEATP